MKSSGTLPKPHASDRGQAGRSVRRKPVGWRRSILSVACVACGVGLGGVACFLGKGNPPASMGSAPSPETDLIQSRVTLSIEELLNQHKNELEKLDIALVNLLCAKELPGAEQLNISNLLADLDQWASRVKQETDRHSYRFRAKPDEYHGSEAYFRMLMMAVVFYEDYNIRYNPERMTSPAAINPNDRFFADSRDIFLHGLLGSHREISGGGPVDGDFSAEGTMAVPARGGAASHRAERRMGTCSSMPVLYTAVGRRLGYPLKLVTTKSHLFLRWEDEKERFNLEATGRGMNRYDDEHFKQWPFPVSEEEIQREGYLKSLSAPEELALFLSLRGNCLKEAGRTQEAAECYAQASQLAPNARSYQALLADLRQVPDPRIRRVSYGADIVNPVVDPNPLRGVGPY